MELLRPAAALQQQVPFVLLERQSIVGSTAASTWAAGRWSWRSPWAVA